MNPSLTAEAAAQLLDGINLLLSRWAALQMAVENEWGGRNSRETSKKLGDVLFKLLTRSKERVYFEDVEGMLDEFMLSELNTEIQDGSIEEVAEKLLVMHEECLEGNFDSIKTLRESNTPTVSYMRQPSGNDEEDSDDDENDDDTLQDDNPSEMEVDNPQFQSSLDQKDNMTSESAQQEAPQVGDGWTVVSSRRSRGRRN